MVLLDRLKKAFVPRDKLAPTGKVRILECPYCHKIRLPLRDGTFQEYSEDYAKIAEHSDTHLPIKVGGWNEVK